MSHIHLPDGVLPVWLWFSGWIITILIGALIFRSLRKEEGSKRLPLVGMMSAVMVLGASVEIIPIAYHINLAVISGILLGPRLIFLSTLVVNILLALFGHGGITVLGLNTLVLSVEGILGYFLCRLFWKGLRRLTPALFMATVISLLVSTFLMIGVVSLGASHYEELMHQEDHPHGIFALKLFQEKVAHHEQEVKQEGVNLQRFITVFLPLSLIGWILEGVITTLIARYLYRLRPELLRLEGARP